MALWMLGVVVLSCGNVAIRRLLVPGGLTLWTGTSLLVLLDFVIYHCSLCQ